MHPFGCLKSTSVWPGLNASPGAALAFGPNSKRSIAFAVSQLVLVAWKKHTAFPSTVIRPLHSLFQSFYLVLFNQAGPIEGDLTGLYVLECFVPLLKAYALPLLCLIQICGCNDRQGHVDHVLLSTARRLVDQTAHGFPTNGVLHQ